MQGTDTVHRAVAMRSLRWLSNRKAVFGSTAEVAITIGRDEVPPKPKKRTGGSRKRPHPRADGRRSARRRGVDAGDAAPLGDFDEDAVDAVDAAGEDGEDSEPNTADEAAELVDIADAGDAAAAFLEEDAVDIDIGGGPGCEPDAGEEASTPSTPAAAAAEEAAEVIGSPEAAAEAILSPSTPCALPLQDVWRTQLASAVEALTHRRDALQNARDWVRSHKCATPARARHVEWSARSSMPMAILDVPGAGIDVYSFSSLTPPPESLPVDTLLSGDLTTVKQGFAYRIREDWLCRYVYPVQRWDPKQSVADATVLHVDIGVHMHKDGARERTLAPIPVRRLRSICRLAATTPVPTLGLVCFMCDKPADDSQPLTTCAVCTLTSHVGCAASCDFKCAVELSSNLLFDHFRPDMMCTLCRAAFRV